MRRRSTSVTTAAFVLAALLLVIVAAFDRHVVAPTLLKAEAALATAEESERQLPLEIKAALNRSLGKQLKYSVSRRLLEASPSQTEGMQTNVRQFVEFGVGTLLPMHLSGEELMSLHASQAYMGEGVKGFAQAAGTHLGVQLAEVSPIQAAKLVVISRAPSIYLSSPERLERQAKALLAKQAE